ncbi:unnamed protein product, partial [Polarella glacialis]
MYDKMSLALELCQVYQLVTKMIDIHKIGHKKGPKKKDQSRLVLWEESDEALAWKAKKMKPGEFVRSKDELVDDLKTMFEELAASCNKPEVELAKLPGFFKERFSKEINEALLADSYTTLKQLLKADCFKDEFGVKNSGSKEYLVSGRGNV